MSRKIWAGEATLEQYTKSSYTIEDGSGCWVWSKALANGYGLVSHNGRTTTAHRVFFEKHVRPLAEGEIVHHMCGNKACVNPEHLCATDQKHHRFTHAGTDGGPLRLFHLRVTEEEKERVEEECEKQGCSQSQLLRIALRRYLKQLEREDL